MTDADTERFYLRGRVRIAQLMACKAVESCARIGHQTLAHLYHESARALVREVPQGTPVWSKLSIKPDPDKPAKRFVDSDAEGRIVPRNNRNLIANSR